MTALPGNVQEQPQRSSTILSAFTSNWFVIVMGWGGMLDVVARVWGTKGVMTGWIETGVWINSSIFAILIAIWLTRWFVSPDRMWAELTHPALSHFFGLIPISMTIIGLNWSLMGAEFGPAVLHPTINVMWLLSVGIGLLFSIIITDALMRQGQSNPAQVSFAWLIGSVANALFPLLGNGVVSEEFKQSLGWARFVNVVDIAYFGMGLFLFIFLTSFLFKVF